jgi:hypothetical protein
MVYPPALERGEPYPRAAEAGAAARRSTTRQLPLLSSCFSLG